MITSGSSAYSEDNLTGEIVHKHSKRRVRVTPAEFCLYRILSSNRGVVFRSRKLTDYYLTWYSRDASQYADEGLIRVMIKNIREKVGSDCIDTVQGRGYMVKA
jgi:two-component system, OmpR family, response regulator VanR